MLIRFLAFWENSFKENIGKVCGKIRVQLKQVSTSWTKRQMSCDLTLTWTGHYAVWLVKNKTKKQNTDLNTNSTTKNK